LNTGIHFCFPESAEHDFVGGFYVQRLPLSAAIIKVVEGTGIKTAVRFFLDNLELPSIHTDAVATELAS
jgi:hypothetical protein